MGDAIPSATASRVQAAQQSGPVESPNTLKVEHKTTLGAVAKQYRVSEGTLRSLNPGLRRGRGGTEIDGGTINLPPGAKKIEPGGAQPKDGFSPANRSQVRDLQRLVGARVDGAFGAETLSKLKAYQSSHNIEPANGDVGPKTLDALSKPTKAGVQQRPDKAGDVLKRNVDAPTYSIDTINRNEAPNRAVDPKRGTEPGDRTVQTRSMVRTAGPDKAKPLESQPTRERAAPGDREAAWRSVFGDKERVVDPGALETRAKELGRTGRGREASSLREDIMATNRLVSGAMNVPMPKSPDDADFARSQIAKFQKDKGLTRDGLTPGHLDYKTYDALRTEVAARGKPQAGTNWDSQIANVAKAERARLGDKLPAEFEADMRATVWQESTNQAKQLANPYSAIGPTQLTRAAVSDLGESARHPGLSEHLRKTYGVGQGDKVNDRTNSREYIRTRHDITPKGPSGVSPHFALHGAYMADLYAKAYDSGLRGDALRTEVLRAYNGGDNRNNAQNRAYVPGVNAWGARQDLWGAS